MSVGTVVVVLPSLSVVRRRGTDPRVRVLRQNLGQRFRKHPSFIISLIARSRYSPHSNLCTCFNRQILLNKLKELFEEKQYVAEREKELDKERMKIQSIIMEGKESEIQSDSDYYAEKLPTPNAVVRQEPQHSGKRTMISCE